MNLRARVRAALPEGAFLRRDRGDALYLSDAPRLGWAGEIPGFRVAVAGGLARLYPEAGLLAECDYAPDALAGELSRFMGGADALPLFTEGLKVLEAPDRLRIAEYEKRVRQAAAVALRTGGGGGLYACALVLAEAKRRVAK